jgi:hypothetical protein
MGDRHHRRLRDTELTELFDGAMTIDPPNAPRDLRLAFLIGSCEPDGLPSVPARMG